jgi:hypothetical protein
MNNESYFKTDLFGNKYWYEDRLLHRLDGPAVEYCDGEKSWYKHGKLHRLDGPAITYNGCDGEWYKDGFFFENKHDFFESLTDEEKAIALFSEDFLNG